MFGLDERRKRGGGGGGKPRIRFGNTGPRGRIYGKAAKGPVAVAKSKYIKAGKGARSAIREHLRYIQERERGEREPERKFFDREREGIERKEVFEKMLEGRGDRTAMHTLILSPGDNGVDLKEYTRESVEALEERLGHKVDWYATIHENTDHYHAHVVIAGKVPGFERELERRQAADRWRGSERWTSEEKELRELLGDRYDERAETDPREDRRAEREFGHGSEREETDPRVKELLDGNRTRSPEELKAEKTLERYERGMAAKERGSERGEVFLDRMDLAELRSAGNDYLHRERSLDRELDRAMEREMSREMVMDFERVRGREVERERDDDFSRGRGRGRGDDEDERGRDDMDRGRGGWGR